MSDTIDTVPVREGIFRETPQGAVLVGQRCLACGQVQFPAGPLCQGCLSDALEAVDLSPEGELFCATTVHMKSAHFDPPYRVGYVALPEGLKVFAPLVAPSDQPLAIGTRMRVELAPMWQEDGKSVVAYRFRAL